MRTIDRYSRSGQYVVIIITFALAIFWANSPTKSQDRKPLAASSQASNASGGLHNTRSPSDLQPRQVDPALTASKATKLLEKASAASSIAIPGQATSTPSTPPTKPPQTLSQNGIPRELQRELVFSGTCDVTGKCQAQGAGSGKPDTNCVETLSGIADLPAVRDCASGSTGVGDINSIPSR